RTSSVVGSPYEATTKRSLAGAVAAGDAAKAAVRATTRTSVAIRRDKTISHPPRKAVNTIDMRLPKRDFTLVWVERKMLESILLHDAVYTHHSKPVGLSRQRRDPPPQVRAPTCTTP